MVFTSCKDDDDNDNQVMPSTPGPLASKLSGTWYHIYEATGSAMSENTIGDSSNGSAIAYNSVIDIYHFDEDGTGDFQRCFFYDDDTDPVLVQGILGYGDFTYGSTADGKVTIALKNNWNQTYPQTWDVTYASETITAKGVDGQELKLEQADEEVESLLNSLADQNGSSSVKYNVNDYKPTGIDNSKWMKSLADSRLVADLSLPGSHDACTAEGWQSKLLGQIAEGTAKTQDLTISEQLKVGVRVFDLRPERVLENNSYVLRCAHGIMQTKMLVKDFFQVLKDFLAANPTEFCILTVDLSATSDKVVWGREFYTLITSTEFQNMFVGFKPRLTVGEIRSRVLILSRHEYANQPVGGYCYGWVSDLEFEKQTQGFIIGTDGALAPLWVQDYWGKSKRTGKDEAVVRMLEAAASRDMSDASPAWVINYPSAYFLLPLSDSYRENAVEANKVTANWLADHTGSVGIIYMDFAGMDKSPSYSTEKLYETLGMTLVDRVIKQNWK
jgi:hypothetical protein